MPGFERTRASVARMNEQTKDAAQKDVPAQNIRNQLPSKVVPPASSTTRGGVTLSDDDPLASDATADPGTSSSASRADHVHPDPGGGALSISDGVTTVSPIDTIVLDGATVDDDGGGQATIHVIGGGSIDVTDGTTTVTSVSELTFPSGTISSAGAGLAEYTPAGGGSGALTLIAELLLLSDATTITFSAIPGTYRHLRLVAMGRITQATTEDYVFIQFNGDTGSNYDNQRMNNASAGNSAAQTKTQIGDFPGTSAPANSAGTFELIIPAYALTTFHKVGRSKSGVWDSGSSGTTNEFFFRWRDASAITSITLLLNSGDFLTGSLFSLYGME